MARLPTRHLPLVLAGAVDPLVVAGSTRRIIACGAAYQPQPTQGGAAHSLRVTLNHNFAGVIAGCAERRSDGTWIGPSVQQAYGQLHRLGHAHSVEVWQGEQLVGGLYGVALGTLFCGESMFSRVSNASKMALWSFCRHFQAMGGQLIDCQVLNSHTASWAPRRSHAAIIYNNCSPAEDSRSMHAVGDSDLLHWGSPIAPITP